MKKGDLQRERILEAAEQLFFSKGYDATAIQDILDMLQISKGGFYHHFDSKASLLAGVCERRVEERLAREAAEVRASHISAARKLNRVLGMAGMFEREEPRFAAMMMRLKLADGDVLVRDCINRIVMEQLLPLINAVIDDGIREGVFSTRFPNTTGRMLLLLSAQMDEEIWRMLLKEISGPEGIIDLVEMIDTYRNMAERALNAPYGSIRVTEVDALLNNYRAATQILSALNADAAGGIQK